DRLILVIEGFLVGALTGIVGVGGGFLIVPALVLLGRLPMRIAVGTSLLIIAVKSGAGFGKSIGQFEGGVGAMDLQTIGVFILLGGVKGGIERLARVLMPTLAVMLLLLVGFVLTLDNAGTGVTYYLVPDFSRINLATINGALSQAFFSLSLGMGILITYGSYFSREDNIAESTRMVAIADTAIAFSAGLLILPAIFAFDPNTNTDDLSTSSVGLIFDFLPQIFLSMQDTVGYGGASFVAIVFFTLVFFAALTSMVSIIEIPIACWIDELGMTRKKAVMLQAILLTIFAVPATMSLGISDFFTNFTSYGGVTKSFFDLVSDVFYETILPFVGFTVCIFCAYKWKVSGLKEELVIGDDKYSGSLTERYINLSLGTVIPIVLLVVFLSTVNQVYLG
ncbi:MAG TPA: hypothetical protein DCR45_00210, partial [Gammaproteobacteria bacterium]|nr:hypothetical protein [Gammaproteobacteria bacterium]